MIVPNLETNTITNQICFSEVRHGPDFNQLALQAVCRKTTTECALFIVELRNPRENVIISVLGGSLTAGRFAGNKPGAWPAQLHHMLREFRLNNIPNMSKQISMSQSHNGSIIIHNNAVAATDMIWALQSLTDLVEPNSDLVIIDYDVNDCSTIGNNRISHTHILTTTELIIRRISELYPNSPPPAIMFLNIAVHMSSRSSIQKDCKTFHSCYSISEMRLPVLNAYYIPMVSQKLALWDNFSCPPPGKPYTACIYLSYTYILCNDI